MTPKKLLRVFILTLLIFNVLGFNITTFGIDTSTKADFRMDFIIDENSGEAIYVNNSVLPNFVGKNLPFKIYCTNLSRGDISYKWFIKYPGEDYKKIDTVKNPVLEIDRYGKIFVRLCINDDESLIRDYYILTKDYSIKKEKYKSYADEYGLGGISVSKKTVITDLTTVISDQPFKNDDIDPVDTKIDLNNLRPSDFKITNIEEVKHYTVNDGPIPVEVKNLPYWVNLSNIGEERNIVWYIKVPKSEYFLMDTGQNTKAQVWHYGTTKFKQVVDGNFANAVEHSVTAYGPGQKMEHKEALANFNKSKSDIRPKADFSLKQLGLDDKIIGDVTDLSLQEDALNFPHKILPINLSYGEKFSEWFVKKPGSNSYKQVSSLPIIIEDYGVTYIKLKLNGDDRLSVEKKVVSYSIEGY